VLKIPQKTPNVKSPWKSNCLILSQTGRHIM